MAHYAAEMFAHFVYSPELTYDELLLREEALKALMEQALTDNGGEFIQYEAIGDALHAQCVFTPYSEDVFQAICEALSPHMNGQVEGRLLFVGKNLECLHLYTLSGGIWQEACLTLPSAGPLGEGLRREAMAE